MTRLVCQGLTNKAIAESIFISEDTVKSHIRNIMPKMEARSRTAIIASVLRLSGISFAPIKERSC